MMIQNKRTRVKKDFSKEYFTFEYRNIHINVLKVNFSNAEFTYNEISQEYILDQWTYDIEILCDGMSFSIYDSTWSNKDGLPVLWESVTGVTQDQIKEVIIEEMHNANDLFTFNDKEVSK